MERIVISYGNSWDGLQIICLLYESTESLRIFLQDNVEKYISQYEIFAEENKKFFEKIKEFNSFICKTRKPESKEKIRQEMTEFFQNKPQPPNSFVILNGKTLNCLDFIKIEKIGTTHKQVFNMPEILTIDDWFEENV